MTARGVVRFTLYDAFGGSDAVAPSTTHGGIASKACDWR